MRTMLLAAAAAAALAATAAPAQAVVLVATWKGIVVGPAGNFSDRLGFAPFADITGKGFTVDYTYDSDRGMLETFSPGESRRGGDIAPFTEPGPATAVTFQLDGGTKLTFDPHTRSQVRSKTGAFLQMNFQQLTGAAGLDGLSLTAFFAASGNLDSTVAPTTLAGTGSNGSFQFLSYKPALGYDTVDASGGFQVTSLVVSEYVAPTPPGPGPLTPTPGVPEPSAWALLILGFGAASASLRARRRAAT